MNQMWRFGKVEISENWHQFDQCYTQKKDKSDKKLERVCFV